MKVYHMTKRSVIAMAFGAMTTMTSHAAFISGSIEFTGRATLDTTAGTATNIAFSNPGSVGVVNGDYSPIPILIPSVQFGASVFFTNFTYGAPGTLGALVVNPLWTLSSGGVTYSFRLDNLTINQYSGTQRLLEGDGMASITGYTDTPGHWALSTSGQDTTITFSSSTDVPDGGASVALLGMSLLGLIGGRRVLVKRT